MRSSAFVAGLLLQFADPPAHLEPAAGGQAQVGPVVGTLQRVDPGAPEPGLQDLVPELLFVPKIHDVPRFLPFGSRNVPAPPPKLHRAPHVIRGTMRSMPEDSTSAPWSVLQEHLAGYFAARARGLLASEFVLSSRSGEEFGRLHIREPEGAHFEAGNLEATIERT